MTTTIRAQRTTPTLERARPWRDAREWIERAQALGELRIVRGASWQADIGAVTDDDDVTFARRLVEAPGVAVVPGSSFYSRPELGRTKVRFAYPKRPETLGEAARRLALFSAPTS